MYDFFSVLFLPFLFSLLAYPCHLAFTSTLLLYIVRFSKMANLVEVVHWSLQAWKRKSKDKKEREIRRTGSGGEEAFYISFFKAPWIK